MGVSLGDIGEQAEGSGRGARKYEQSADHHDREDRPDHDRQALAVIDEQRANDDGRASGDADEDDRRAPVQLEAVAPEHEADEEHDESGSQARADERGIEAAHQQLVVEARITLADQLEDRLGGPQSERRVDRDPGRGEQPDV